MRTPFHARRAALAAALTAGVTAVSRLGAQPAAVEALSEPWPKKPLGLLTPFPPGAGADLLVRLLAAQLARQLGRPVVVDSRGAAGGSTSAWIASKARADGHSYFVGAVHDLIASAGYPKLRFDIDNDLVPVTSIAQVPLALLVNAQRVGETNLIALLKRLRAQPGKLVCGTTGAGTVVHEAAEQFRQHTRTQFTYATYRSPMLVLADLVDGKIDMALDALGMAAPYLQSGQLRALTVATAERLAAFDGVPTALELGLRDWRAAMTYGLWAVKDAPQTINERMVKEIDRALKVPDLALAWAHYGAQVMVMLQADFTRQVQGEIDRWLKLKSSS